jgi:hypothetical protein
MPTTLGNDLFMASANEWRSLCCSFAELLERAGNVMIKAIAVAA